MLQACGPAENKEEVNQATVVIKPMSLAEMQRRKAEIDDLAGSDAANYTVLAKVKGRTGLVTVIDHQWPPNMEYNYNILKDSTGRVIMIAASPFSESGDWFVAFTHYFTPDGKTFAFERKGNAMKLPQQEVAFETTVDFYDGEFKSVYHSYQLVDKDQKPLDKKYAFDYAYLSIKAYLALQEVLKAYSIKL